MARVGAMMVGTLGRRGLASLAQLFGAPRASCAAALATTTSSKATVIRARQQVPAACGP